jgi:hypothetical protein
MPQIIQISIVKANIVYYSAVDGSVEVCHQKLVICALVLELFPCIEFLNSWTGTHVDNISSVSLRLNCMLHPL